VSASSFFRKEVAALYDIQSIVFEPRGNSVIEFGISSRSWSQMPPIPAIPKRTMRRAFETMGAAYTIFWQVNVGSADCVCPTEDGEMAGTSQIL